MTLNLDWLVASAYPSNLYNIGMVELYLAVGEEIAIATRYFLDSFNTGRWCSIGPRRETCSGIEMHYNGLLI